jgi:hypothetical protein
MSVVDQVLERTTFVETIDGIDYRLRRWSTMMALAMQGEKVFGLLEGAEMVDRGMADPLGPSERIEVIGGYLKHGMVSPRIGDVTDAEQDTITVQDLGDHALQLMVAIKGSSADPADFGESSPDQKESP